MTPLAGITDKNGPIFISSYSEITHTFSAERLLGRYRRPFRITPPLCGVRRVRVRAGA